MYSHTISSFINFFTIGSVIMLLSTVPTLKGQIHRLLKCPCCSDPLPPMCSVSLRQHRASCRSDALCHTLDHFTQFALKWKCLRARCWDSCFTASSGQHPLETVLPYLRPRTHHYIQHVAALFLASVLIS